MKLTINQQDLLPALQSVARSCGVRATLPVLANILLSADKDKLKLAATNLEIGVVKLVPAKVSEGGEITVPARTLLEVVSSLGGKINLELSGDRLTIATDNFTATLNCIPAQEFPPIPLSAESVVNLEAEALTSSLPRISFAAASDEGRPILTGILTEIKKDSLEMVATDGFRLAHQKVRLSKEAEGIRVLIPRRTLEEVVRLIEEEEVVDGLAISNQVNQNQMVFKLGSTILSSRLIEGQFPAWEKIIPEKASTRVIADRAELLKVVKLAAVFAKDSANIVKLETKDKKVKLTSETKELGGQESELEAQVEGEAAFVAFNSKFLVDALSAPSSSQVLLEFSGSLSPVLIKPIGEEGLEYVIMPVRLS